MYQRDRVKHRKSQHDWYMANRERLIPIAVERKKEDFKRERLWLREFKASLECLKCGENHIACLDFHHRDPKEKDSPISSKVGRWSRKRIMAEIEKCDVLCSNCHRKEHWKEE